MERGRLDGAVHDLAWGFVGTAAPLGWGTWLARTTGSLHRGLPHQREDRLLARRLTENASVPFGNEQPGDLCYWTPRGNPALFYETYRYSPGLIRLGRFDGLEPLPMRGDFPVRLEAIR